jgi:hypothetical protein
LPPTRPRCWTRALELLLDIDFASRTEALTYEVQRLRKLRMDAWRFLLALGLEAGAMGLADEIRQRIDAGILPRSAPVKVYAGHGQGSPAAAVAGRS